MSESHTVTGLLVGVRVGDEEATKRLVGLYLDRLAAVGRQLLELLEELARAVLLIGREMLPGFHAVQHPLLLLRRQARKMLQPLLQPGLLLRRKPAELRIVFERAALL